MNRRLPRRQSPPRKRSPKLPQVVIYTTATCPYCIKAKTLLNRLHISYIEKNVRTPSIRREMEHRSGRRTVPQIFIRGHHIGGYDDLVKYVHI